MLCISENRVNTNITYDLLPLLCSYFKVDCLFFLPEKELTTPNFWCSQHEGPNLTNQSSRKLGYLTRSYREATPYLMIFLINIRVNEVVHFKMKVIYFYLAELSRYKNYDPGS